MLARIFRFFVVRYAGAGRATVLLGGFDLARKTVRRQPLVEELRLRPGETYVVEHLGINHKDQIGQLERERKAARRADRAARKAARKAARRRAS
jgi:hypothetical protein